MVRIPGQSFAVSQYEVTFDEWDACVAAGGCNGYRPGDRDWGRGNRPVIYVSWDDAQAFAQWLSQRTGQRYRLLTEAEWEYAARAGTTTTYSWGDQDPVCDLRARNGANFAACDDDRTRPVGAFQPNGFGLYDVHGNVSEWVEECYEPSCIYDGRVFRGGSWDRPSSDVDSASRGWNEQDARGNLIGFRIARIN
ncbi:MAG: formylglycine-generating enzyme family protein [Hyphomonadaceae bacterium]|jgi:formylglycine-generating enzyme required for sulfatase activity|nr:formylglycine-generating enzyme family protein [Hyphomonadaceae bacterium]